MSAAIPTRGDRVVDRWCASGLHHGEVETVYPAKLQIEPTEVGVRWNDGSWTTYDASRFVPDGSGTWALKR
jgi:hypothetical protein